ncbi:MAG: maleylpyruvate isomerase family mycothiol-dependent enzyme [Phycicoccus sp.]|nr:maleylpyruvate isomerase family mycothiol-dependent enzyme [Phycicoccus sp.]
MVDVPTLLIRHTDLLLTTAGALEAADAPSLCEGWTRGHVLTHLARNADGLCALVRSAVDRSKETMYLSDQARDDDIAAGATRDPAVLLTDVRDSAHALAQALPRLTAVSADTVVHRTPGGQSFTTGQLPFMRLRELVYHHVDLDTGFGFEDVEPDLVALLLADEYARLSPTQAARARSTDLWWRARGIRKELP